MISCKYFFQPRITLNSKLIICGVYPFFVFVYCCFTIQFVTQKFRHNEVIIFQQIQTKSPSTSTIRFKAIKAQSEAEKKRGEWNNKRCHRTFGSTKSSAPLLHGFALFPTICTVSHVYFSTAHADSRRGGINNPNFMASAELTQRAWHGDLPRYNVVVVCVQCGKKWETPVQGFGHYLRITVTANYSRTNQATIYDQGRESKPGCGKFSVLIKHNRSGRGKKKRVHALPNQ